MDERQEKRRSVRVTRPLYVQYGIVAGSGVSWDMSLIRDISEDGSCIRTAFPLEKEDRCFLRFKVPNAEDPLVVSARVLESRAIGHGTFMTRVAFLEVDEEQKMLLKEFIATAIANERGRT
jgi:hypothetical protein